MRGHGGKEAADEGRCGVDEVHGGHEGDMAVSGIFLDRLWRMGGPDWHAQDDVRCPCCPYEAYAGSGQRRRQRETMWPMRAEGVLQARRQCEAPPRRVGRS